MNRKKINQRRRERYANDPVYREKIKSYMRNYLKNKYQAEPEFRKKMRSRVKGYSQTTIPKGQLCQQCKKRPAVERHHEDYNKPVDVLLVCRPCHVKLDKGSVVAVSERIAQTPNDKRRSYEKEYKRTFRDRINARRRERYANDESFRLKERERVRKATKPWSQLTEVEKEKKRRWQRNYMRERYQTDPEFREKQKNKARKSSGSFMRFGGYKSGNNKKRVMGTVLPKGGTGICVDCGSRRQADLILHQVDKHKFEVLCKSCHRKRKWKPRVRK